MFLDDKMGKIVAKVKICLIFVVGNIFLVPFILSFFVVFGCLPAVKNGYFLRRSKQYCCYLYGEQPFLTAGLKEKKEKKQTIK